jgi:hypothetical protein
MHALHASQACTRLMPLSRSTVCAPCGSVWAPTEGTVHDNNTPQQWDDSMHLQRRALTPCISVDVFATSQAQDLNTRQPRTQTRCPARGIPTAPNQLPQAGAKAAKLIRSCFKTPPSKKVSPPSIGGRLACADTRCACISQSRPAIVLLFSHSAVLFRMTAQHALSPLLGTHT